MIQRIRVATIIMNGQKILLVKHVHPENGFAWWVPPGGGLEDKDNSIFDCAKREAFEETNLAVDVSKIIYLREFLDSESDKINLEVFMLAKGFNGEIGIQNIQDTGEDDYFIKDVAWFSKEDLQKMVVFPEILKDKFWDDLKTDFSSTKYLGRQIG